MTTTSLRLGSSELALNTSSALTETHDEVSLPYIDDISPRELKAAEVMVKEEVRRRDFFFTRALCVRAVVFDRSPLSSLLPRGDRDRRTPPPFRRL